MKILSILSQKGGVGKTTLATCLAVAAEQDGQKTVILDIDPQATASFWHDTREAETPNVMSVQVSRLEHTLKSAEQSDVDLIIIDGAAVARDLAYEAAKFSDHILIPTKTAVFDTASMMHTVDIVQGQGKDCSIILTFVPPVGHEIEQAINWLTSMDLDICPVLIGNRKDYFRAQTTGLTVQEFKPTGKAAQEIKELYHFITAKLSTKGD